MAKTPITTEMVPVEQKAIGGGLEGAERTTRETFNWAPAVISPDRQINPNKEMADARSLDSVQNDGFAMGAVGTHRDSIVGSQFRLNAQPNIDVLGADEGWLEEFQRQTESRFNLMAQSEECWFDASGRNTFTNMVRLAVVGEILTGEVLATAEWLRSTLRPFSTAIQMVSPSRLSNPDNTSDTRYLRRGVAIDRFGRPLGYHIRASHPTDFYNDMEVNRWIYVPARKPWGRRQVLHIIQQMRPDQTRGISDMVAVLKNMRMTKKFRDVTLQNAVVNASYAAAVESELPREVVFGALGAGQPGFADMLSTFMTALNQYVSASDNIAIDGVKIPHLFPGTKLNLKPMGTPGGIGTDFEESLLRHTAATLGLSYEQFAKDYSKTNYSSARASMGETEKHMAARKKAVADRFASMVYALWFEEELNAGNIPMPSGKTAEIFYDPVMREALLNHSWIGAGRGQIDEKKETESAILRIQNNLSTLEAECARLGQDYRHILRQRAREQKMLKELDLMPPAPQQMGQNAAQDSTNGSSENQNDGENQNV
jgi:lambda family phage portal protein